MTNDRIASGGDAGDAQSAHLAFGAEASTAGKRTISPAERWLRIHEGAYLNAQRHGFIGGDPFEEWLEAEREVDGKYATDFRIPFSLSDASELTSQFKRIFGGFGIGRHRLDSLLTKNGEQLEKLAECNRILMGSASELASKQTLLFQDAVSEAMKSLHSLAEGRLSAAGFAKQAQLSTQAVENVLTHIRKLTECLSGSTRPSDDEKKKLGGVDS